MPLPSASMEFTGKAKDSWSPWRKVDGASLFFFRFVFGFVIAWWAWDYLVSGRVHYLYVNPKVHFTYPGFDWVKPLPGSGMYCHFLSVVCLAGCVSLGFLYRYTSFALAILFTYFFLIDKTNYQNHYYLLVILCWLLACLPLGSAASLDCLLFRKQHVYSLWIGQLWLARCFVGIPYFYGGLAKLSSDWFAGCPLRQTLQQYRDWPVVGSFVSSESTTQLLIWGGLLFDLMIVPLLLVKRTRLAAFFLCIGFHVTNSVLFRIHVFPWFMILATTLFFESNWPRKWLGATDLEPQRVESMSSPRKFLWSSLALIVLVIQMLVPLRHWLYPRDVNWTEQGHTFSWRMMLRGKISVVRYYLTDRNSGETTTPILREYINVDQLSRMAMDPMMIRQLGLFLESEYRDKNRSNVQVRALALSSLNGRKAQLLVDPEMDISSQSDSFAMNRWIQPLTEPLPPTPWTVPIEEWTQQLKLPELKFPRKE